MNSQNMTLGKLFKSVVQYEIPDYQRRYTWREDDQWEPLWIDVRERVEEFEEQLLTEANPTVRPHFLGAVVLQDLPANASEPTRWAVIDGQQRLTTLQLLLDAAQEELEVRNSRVARFLEKMIENDRTFWEGNERHRLKIVPTFHDREAFNYAMSSDLDGSRVRGTKIGDAHAYFRDRVREWLAEPVDGDAIERRETALLQVLDTGLEVIAIEVGSSDDANRIFETLNARGTPLRAWDLSKNFLMNRFPDANAISLLERFDSNWWQLEEGHGRNRRSRIDNLLIDYTMMRTAEKVETRSPRDIYLAFRKYAEDDVDGEKSIAGVIYDLIRVGPVYEELTTHDDNAPWGVFLRRWRVLPVGPFRSVLLWLASEALDALELEASAKVLESYFARRMFCDMTTSGGGQDLLKITLDLLAVLPTFGKETIADDIEEFFEPALDPELRMRWPNDSEFANALNTDVRIYRRLTQARVRMLLEAIELELRDPLLSEQGVPGHLTIEHVLPQSWSAPEQDWPLPKRPHPAVGERQPSEFRDHLMHCLGNLTLVTKNLNSKLSNRSWENKRKALDSSVLQLNKELQRNSRLEAWDEYDIIDRGERFAEIAKRIWPEPGAFQPVER